MLSLSHQCRYFLYSGKTDMRKGFDSLSGIVRSKLNENPMNGDIFIFLNRNRNHVKLLLWEGDGFSMYHKRLERGTYEIPVHCKNVTKSEISASVLQLVLQGISLESVRHRKRYKSPGNL
ncbi:IS66 family insertion sequence element accessory protein TnpB [Cytophagaceae bacterium ABcell3]|nr:IS66 family insertion sequence element accessory protein TnpB [Cytophagaceae bacterium ABcell3]WMJ72118.1 IS66 family insertion sequence element accessory protein TnpB [Cytophagaceae bacterium ABcell3]WMJ72222.1 IS66 family insertion sequence element accessory protein TnpB [Cytophagaceae bacterium ABcell3]WMJ72237.1 IS66 family insertion sequence element accessory protein TnpB [Cytophagaceae bacterium ABcell3]WMJ73493.1 IS66 family insertion sequence element accessory protein TnpB [Cytophaga